MYNKRSYAESTECRLCQNYVILFLMLRLKVCVNYSPLQCVIKKEMLAFKCILLAHIISGSVSKVVSDLVKSGRGGPILENTSWRYMLCHDHLDL